MNDVDRKTVDEEKILRPSVLAWRGFKRDKAALVGSFMVVFLLIVALFCPLLAPYDPLRIAPDKQLEPPSWDHWMGRDRQGRDVFSRVLYGAGLYA